MARITEETFAAIYNDIDRYPSLAHVAAELGIARKTVRNRAGTMRSRNTGPKLIDRSGTGRNQHSPNEPTVPVFRSHDIIKPIERPVGGETRYYILSSCQDESKPHHAFMDNLEAYAAWLGNCEIMIAGFTYNKSIFEANRRRPEAKKTSEIYYHERLAPYLQNEQFQLCEGLLFCGEMNTLPTAVRPLSGFETYTTSNWGIFPHPKVQLESIPTNKMERSKQLMTTGCVTLPNYVQKKAGIKASFHHIIGAVLVEVAPDGSFFCRHIQADGVEENEGGFFDLDRRVENGEVTVGHRVEALNYGDIHHEKLDPTVAASTWGYDVEDHSEVAIDGEPSLLDFLRPRHQFFHDLSDFTPRNHHNIKDHHFQFATWKTGVDDVEAALAGCASFLALTKREWCKSVVVQSNHDNAFLKWLKTADYREDPANALFFLQAQTSYYEQLAAGHTSPPIFEQVLRARADLDTITFVGEDDSYTIAGNIECAMHGHLGANGSRGNPKQFSKFGRKSNTGHTHSPMIFDGAFVAGVSGSLDMGYNVGPSSWAHSHIVTYPNGKRTIITMMNGHWYAPVKEVKVKSRKADCTLL